MPRRISQILAQSETRAWFHAGILLAGAGILLASVLNWGFFKTDAIPQDKALHFQAGRLIAAIIFYGAYFCIIVRVLLVGSRRGSMTRALLWVPTMIAVALILAVAGGVAVGIGKEFWDIGGGSVEWFDMDATVEGALSMTIPVAIIMALTPLLIPFDMLLQLPRLMLSDMRTGISALDNYLREQRSHSTSGRTAEVLLVEDDIVCATTAMNFCRTLGLTCHHVSTISAADTYLREHLRHLKLVVLDNFVHVDSQGAAKTGSQWLVDISGEFPVNRRPFLVAIISGYTNLLGEAAVHADIVMQKPWDPQHLAAFLRNKGMLTQRSVRP